MIAWGKKVSPEFAARVVMIAGELGINPNHLMACMAFETGRTFSTSIRNAAGSGAVGLIQFIPATARRLGTTTEALARMSAVEQLEYVRRYFLPYKGRLSTLHDVYMAILWPAGIGKPLDAGVSREQCPRAYELNKGLDADRDYVITKREACAHVVAQLARGLDSENVA